MQFGNGLWGNLLFGGSSMPTMSANPADSWGTARWGGAAWGASVLGGSVRLATPPDGSWGSIRWGGVPWGGRVNAAAGVPGNAGGIAGSIIFAGIAGAATGAAGAGGVAGSIIFAGTVGGASGTAGLTAGILSLTGQTTTTITLGFTGGSGGTPPYTYQLQRSPTGLNTFANDGAALTGQSGSASLASIGLTASTTYDYNVIVTDIVVASATSATVTESTAGAGGVSAGPGLSRFDAATLTARSIL